MDATICQPKGGRTKPPNGTEPHAPAEKPKTGRGGALPGGLVPSGATAKGAVAPRNGSAIARSAIARDVLISSSIAQQDPAQGHQTALVLTAEGREVGRAIGGGERPLPTEQLVELGVQGGEGLAIQPRPLGIGEVVDDLEVVEETAMHDGVHRLLHSTREPPRTRGPSAALVALAAWIAPAVAWAQPGASPAPPASGDGSAETATVVTLAETTTATPSASPTGAAASPSAAAAGSAAPGADAATPGATAEPAALDLAALTRRALRHYPSLRGARHRVAAAEARLDEATISPFFQGLNATVSVTMAPESRGSPVFSPDSQLPLSNDWRPVIQAGIEGVVPLYTFGKLSAARDAAQAGVDAAHLSVEQSRAKLRYDVRRAYYALQLSLDVQQMIREGQSRLQRAATRLEEQIEAGDEGVNEMDRFRLSTTLAEVEARRSEAIRLEASSRYALALMTGGPVRRVVDCPMAPLAFNAENLDGYVERARHGRPEARMLSAAQQAREANVRANRARYFPDIGVALSVGQSYGPGITDQTNPFVVDRANYTTLGAALVARWSLDLWGNAYRVGRTEAELDELVSQREEAELGMSLEVADAYHTVADARRRETAWGAGHRDARAWFVAASQAYQVGALEPKELIDAVRTYFNARFNHLEAIRSLNTGLASLERAVGGELLPAGGWEVACEPLAP